MDMGYLVYVRKSGTTNVHEWLWECRYIEAAIRTSGRATRLRGTSIRVPVEKGFSRLQRLTRTSVLTQTAPESKSLVQNPNNLHRPLSSKHTNARTSQSRGTLDCPTNLSNST